MGTRPAEGRSRGLKHAARRVLLAVLALGLIVPASFAENRAPGNLRRTYFELPKYLPVLEKLFGEDHETATESRPYWRKNLFRRVGGDQIYLLTTWWPDEFGEVRFTLPIALAAVAASRTGSDPDAWDLRTARRMQAWSTGGRLDAARFLSKLGESGPAFLLISSTYLISRWVGNERIERATSLSGEALLNGTIYVGILKRVMRRTRPFGGGTGEFFVSNPPPGQSNGSYPSGHATGAFAIAAVFSHEFRDHRWVPWVAYGTAGLIALSRVSLGRHFPTDIVTGAILGDSLGRMVSHRSASHTAGLDPMWARFQPHVNPENRAIGVVHLQRW